MDSNQIKSLTDETFQQRILDLSLNGIYVYDIKKGTNVYINKQYERLTGYSLAEINGMTPKQFFNLFHEQDQVKIDRHMQLVSQLQLGEFLEVEYRFKMKNGKWMWCLSRDGILSVDGDGSNTQFMGAFVDITERKLSEQKSKKLNSNLENLVHERTAELEQSVKKQALLMREIHHRVKNNLQLLSSFFSLYIEKEDNPKVIGAVTECINNIHSLSMVYKNLYQTNDLTQIDFGDYLRNLCSHLESSLGNNKAITTVMDIENIVISVDQAITCGLIVNELITNTYKHAFNGRKEGIIKVSLKARRQDVVLTIKDNGLGFPKNYDVRTESSFGLGMVVSLAEQIDAEIDFISKKGLTCILSFHAN